MFGTKSSQRGVCEQLHVSRGSVTDKAVSHEAAYLPGNVKLSYRKNFTPGVILHSDVQKQAFPNVNIVERPLESIF